MAAVAECRPGTMSGFRPTLDAHERDDALAAFADIPTAVLAGTRDRLTPVPMARRIARSAAVGAADGVPRRRAHAARWNGRPGWPRAGLASAGRESAATLRLVDQREARQAAPRQARQ